MSYPFLVDFDFAPGNLLPGYRCFCCFFFPMLNELKAAFEPSHSSTYQKHSLDSINPFFSIQILNIVQFQSLSFQKAQSNLQLNVAVAGGTFFFDTVAVVLRDRTKKFPPGGCTETRTRKKTCFRCFRLHFKVDILLFFYTLSLKIRLFIKIFCSSSRPVFFIFVFFIIQFVPVYDSTYILAISFCLKESKTPGLVWRSCKIKNFTRFTNNR